MKSAYEIAMGKLEKSAPTVKLTEKQKQVIADIDSQYVAKIAERKVFLEGEIKKAELAGESGEIEKLRTQLASEIARLEEECEEKKIRART